MKLVICHLKSPKEAFEQAGISSARLVTADGNPMTTVPRERTAVRAVGIWLCIVIDVGGMG